ncbi:hypothetical protein [Paraferrimonas sp. SM1919]|uniref:hypothetical protein n=1 Tax=Paraferrimonas sp. SM1919 TaxID=2662263 RepID=UPI0013D7D9B8|nr:hypothetical protein [Paraferrimonas sp. SM1919]
MLLQQKQSSSNFTFLDDVNPMLFQLAQEAEAYLHIDNQACLAKMRLFVEVSCHLLAQKAGINLNQQTNELANNLNILRDKTNVSNYTIAACQRLRYAANSSLHVSFVAGQMQSQPRYNAEAMNKLAHDLFEVASGVAEYVYGAKVSTTANFYQQQQCEHATLMVSAMKGSSDASMELAGHFYDQLEQSQARTGERYTELKQDFGYWLNKAIKQQATGHQLLQAKAAQQGWYHHNYLSVEQLFKEACDNDTSGEACFAYGEYIANKTSKGDIPEAWNKAAELGNHKALLAKQMETFNQDQAAFDSYIEKGKANKQPFAHSFEAWHLLLEYIKDSNDLSKRRLKTALLDAYSKQDKGYQFVCAMAAFYGVPVGMEYHKYDHEELAEIMANHYTVMPENTLYHGMLLLATAKYPKHITLASNMARKSLHTFPDDQDKGELCYNLAKSAQQALNEKGQARIAISVAQLYKQAADLGNSQAREFLASKQGKAELNKISCPKYNKRSKTTKNKRKASRKQARANKKK